MKGTVLIIEDDRAIQEGLKDLLEMEGYITHSTFDGSEALTWLKKNSALPNVILLDLMMKPMDGFTFRDEQLKDARFAKIPTIIFSADGQVDHKVAAAKGCAYIRKPIVIDQLLRLIEKYCTSKDNLFPSARTECQ